MRTRSRMQHGIAVGFTANNNIVGYDGSGIVATEANRVRFNTTAGVAVFLADSTGNRVSGNRIDSNGQLGIDLSNGAGPNSSTEANDTGDGDTGANNFQNFPVITAAIPTGIMGTLNSTPNTDFFIEFFRNASCDSSGYGEGENYLSSLGVTTDANGNATFGLANPVDAAGWAGHHGGSDQAAEQRRQHWRHVGVLGDASR